jgi:hypothetical protein
MGEKWFYISGIQQVSRERESECSIVFNICNNIIVMNYIQERVRQVISFLSFSIYQIKSSLLLSYLYRRHNNKHLSLFIATLKLFWFR